MGSLGSEDYQALFYSSVLMEHFNCLRERINLFLPINKHISRELAQLKQTGTAVLFFVLLTQLLLYKITYFESAFQNRSG